MLTYKPYSLNQAESTKTRLYAKQGRNARFKSKKDRDIFLDGECAKISTDLAKQQSIKANLDNEIATYQNQLQTTTDSVAQLRTNLNGRDENIRQYQMALDEATETWNKLNDSKKDLQRHKRESDARLETAKAELDKAEKTLSTMMDRPTARGLNAMRRIRQEGTIPGIYGTLAELCQVDERYRTAVEATASSRYANLTTPSLLFSR